MTNKAHSTLTGSDLHEPKGTASATAGQVYISDGLGSGAWTDTGATIGTSNFTTGDLKPTWKTTADSGWIMCDDGTIGDVSSGATTLASGTTSSLYTLLWTNFANTEAAVSSGRGASAAADYAAHKTIALPKMLGRVYGIAGSGAGLTSRVLGKTVGEETHSLTEAELPNLTKAISATAPIFSTGHANGQGANNEAIMFPGATTAVTGTVTFGGGTAAPWMQPTVFLQMMVKL